MPRRFLSWIVFLVCLRPAIAADTLNLRVVEGQGAINNVRTRMARAPVVELRDDQGNPIAGAAVTFQTPATGPSAEFGAEHLLVTQTDSEGRATGLGLVPNDLAGPFEIRVTASFSAKTASATIKQINASPSESRSSKKPLWIALAVGATAGGVLAVAHGHSSAATPPASSSTSATLVSGPTSFGPPH